MKHVTNKKLKELLNWLSAIAGGVLLAAAYNLFFIPNTIAPGGLTGLAQLLHTISGIPVGIMIVAFNVPLLIMGRKMRGKPFLLRTLTAIAISALLIDIVKFPDFVYQVFSDQLLLATVYGGAIMGLGLGLAISGDSTTGGSDLIAVLIHTKNPRFRVAWLLYFIDACVVLTSAFIYSPVLALYALAALFIQSKVIDIMQTGLYSAKAVYIISEHNEKIKDYILGNLSRGATLLKGLGAYNSNDMNVILCVVTGRELHPLRTQIRLLDPDAFVIVSDVKEVEGKGFTH